MKKEIVILKNRLFAIRFLRFFLSGVGAFVVDTTVLIIIKTFLFNGVDYKLFDSISIAKLISGTFGIALMFTLNRVWVFSESKGVSIKKQGSKYFIVTLINLVIASILFAFFTTLISQAFPIDYMLHLSLFVILANLLTEGIKMVLSFFAYKYLVFS